MLGNADILLYGSCLMLLSYPSILTSVGNESMILASGILTRGDNSVSLLSVLKEFKFEEDSLRLMLVWKLVLCEEWAMGCRGLSAALRFVCASFLYIKTLDAATSSAVLCGIMT